jgi:pimeloyl-ACP methyl ester carboxylesterase
VGFDPELGIHFVEGLTDTFQVLFFDYEGHRFQYPNPERLTPDNIVTDFLHIADEMNIKNLSYYGYSWLALVGLQLAIRTNRLESLVMGGFPPYEGPYQEMMIVTNKTYMQALSTQGEGIKRPHGAWNSDDMDWANIEVTIDPRVNEAICSDVSESC